MEEKTIDLLQASYYDITQNTYAYAILPWGATEPHNYHLPYLTDCYLSYYIGIDAAEKVHETKKIKGMVLPPVPFGSQNPGQFDLPFCLHGSHQTQFAILKDVVYALNRQGIRTLFIINGHGGNSFKHMIRDLSLELPDFLIVSIDWFKVEPQAGYFTNKDDHAGEMETSVLMYYRPDLVDLTTAGTGEYTPFKSQALAEGVGWTPRNWMRVSKDTGIGDPSQSTPEKGERYAKVVIGKIADLIQEVVIEGIYTE